MKRKFLQSYIVVLFSALTVLLSGCLGSDDEDDVVYYHDTAIASFKLGTMRALYHTTNSSGEDSTYYVSDDYSDVAFYIDQTNRLIYNPDSLPKGVDLTRTLCTITSENGGTIKYKSLISDSIFTYSSSDSIDFSQPRQFVVYSNAGTEERWYTIKINRHEQDEDEFSWSQVTSKASALTSLTAMKAINWNSNIYLFGAENGVGVVYSTAESDGKTWTKLTFDYTSSPSADIYKNVAVKSDGVYMLDDGKLMYSTDVKNWTQVATPSISQLIGASDTRLYGINGSAILSSSDNGTTWTSESLDASADYLPTQDINLMSKALKTNESSNQLLLTGNRNVSSDAFGMVWGKVEENASESENQSWAYYNTSSGNTNKLPHLENLQTSVYGDMYIAIGGKGMNASTDQAFSAFYTSQDGGATWLANDSMAFPDGFNSSETVFAMVVDSQNYIWIICGDSGQVWRGRLSKLGWSSEQTYFTE